MYWFRKVLIIEIKNIAIHILIHNKHLVGNDDYDAAVLLLPQEFTPEILQHIKPTEDYFVDVGSELQKYNALSINQELFGLVYHDDIQKEFPFCIHGKLSSMIIPNSTNKILGQMQILKGYSGCPIFINMEEMLISINKKQMLIGICTGYVQISSHDLYVRKIPDEKPQIIEQFNYNSGVCNIVSMNVVHEIYMQHKQYFT